MLIKETSFPISEMEAPRECFKVNDAFETNIQQRFDTTYNPPYELYDPIEMLDGNTWVVGIIESTDIPGEHTVLLNYGQQSRESIPWHLLRSYIPPLLHIGTAVRVFINAKWCEGIIVRIDTNFSNRYDITLYDESVIERVNWNLLEIFTPPVLEKFTKVETNQNGGGVITSSSPNHIYNIDFFTGTSASDVPWYLIRPLRATANVPTFPPETAVIIKKNVGIVKNIDEDGTYEILLMDGVTCNKIDEKEISLYKPHVYSPLDCVLVRRGDTDVWAPGRIVIKHPGNNIYKVEFEEAIAVCSWSSCEKKNERKSSFGSKGNPFPILTSEQSFIDSSNSFFSCAITPLQTSNQCLNSPMSFSNRDAGETMLVKYVIAGKLAINQVVTGFGIKPGTSIVGVSSVGVEQITGGSGIYTLSLLQDTHGVDRVLKTCNYCDKVRWIDIKPYIPDELYTLNEPVQVKTDTGTAWIAGIVSRVYGGTIYEVELITGSIERHIDKTCIRSFVPPTYKIDDVVEYRQGKSGWQAAKIISVGIGNYKIGFLRDKTVIENISWHFLRSLKIKDFQVSDNVEIIHTSESNNCRGVITKVNPDKSYDVSLTSDGRTSTEKIFWFNLQKAGRISPPRQFEIDEDVLVLTQIAENEPAHWLDAVITSVLPSDFYNVSYASKMKPGLNIHAHKIRQSYFAISFSDLLNFDSSKR